ncbi:MAG: tetratricopeptide repeat protein [Chthoniobacterales bacterium]|nr:tetratricopeptide repeat protein [Chthoniobacterales bacterium]
MMDRKNACVLLLGSLFFLSSLPVAIAANDPAEDFLTAYQNFQQAEQFERGGKRSEALEKYQFSQSILMHLSANYPDWQKAVVDYRLAKVAKSLERLAVGSGSSVNSTPYQEQEVPPPSHQANRIMAPKADNPSISIIPPSNISVDSKSGVSDQEVALLQKQLKKAMEDLEKAHNTIADQATELDHSKVMIVDMKSQLEKTERQAIDLKSDLSKIRSKHLQQEAQLQQSVHALEGKVTALSADKEVILEENSLLQQHLKQATDSLAAGVEAKGRLEQLQMTINAEKNISAALHEKLAVAYHERDATNGQKEALQKQLQEVTSSLASAKKEAQETASLRLRVEELQQQHATLTGQLEQSAKKLTESDKKIAALEQAEPEKNRLLENKEKELVVARQDSEKFQKELAAANEKLSALQTELQSKDDRYQGLKKEFDAKNEELATLKKNQKEHPVEEKAIAENELLKGIVMRELKAEAKRQQTKKLITEELEKLKLNSTTLSTELKKLVKPVKLTPQERALFKDAPLPPSSEDEEEETMVLSVAASKKEALSSNSATPLDTNVSTSAASNNTTATVSVATNAPSEKDLKVTTEDYHKVIARAKEEFEQQNYKEAEKDFQSALAVVPKDYLTLSNLGVVEFQLGKMSSAEETLKKAIVLDSKKSFALTTLGIVHYRQERMDEAEKVLRQAIAINDQDFTAHNYLGIVLAAAGKGKAGESEIMKALEMNPQYADAHFNLAVIYATGKPPSKEMAKQHYTKARGLGAPPDATLEKLLE